MEFQKYTLSVQVWLIKRKERGIQYSDLVMFESGWVQDLVTLSLPSEFQKDVAAENEAKHRQT